MQSSCTKRKTGIVLGVAVLTNLVKDCPKDLGKIAGKVSLNMKEGQQKGKSDPSETSSGSTGIPDEDPQSLKMSQKVKKSLL